MKEQIASDEVYYRGYKVKLLVRIEDQDEGGYHTNRKHVRRYVKAKVYDSNDNHQFNKDRYVKLTEKPDWGLLKCTILGKILRLDVPTSPPMPLEDQTEKRLNEVADKIDQFENAKQEPFSDGERSVSVEVNRESDELNVELHYSE